MYTNTVTSQDQALCHLYFHCALKDNMVTDAELDLLSARFVELGLQKNLNFKNEMMHYRAYQSSITDEKKYLDHLIKLIHPVNELALYSYCVELTFSDDTMDIMEEQLLGKIANILRVDEAQQHVVKDLIAQRKVVETQKIV